MNKEIVRFFKDCIKRYDVGNRLIFEILESENITNYEAVYEFVLDIKNLGCRIAIDDFGSGYSNFEHVLKLDVDFIKIDSTLIERRDVDSYSRIIVETIVDFCEKLNIKTIAEKVHSESVYREVKKHAFFMSRVSPCVIIPRDQKRLRLEQISLPVANLTVS